MQLFSADVLVFSKKFKKKSFDKKLGFFAYVSFSSDLLCTGKAVSIVLGIQSNQRNYY